MTEYASRHFVRGDHLLRRDVRLMGWHLRHLVREHGGGALWDRAHRLRELAELRQGGDDQAEAAILGQIGELPVHELASLTRVFGLFFDLANLAEDRHRVRVLLRREREGRPSETINEAVEALQATDLSRDELRDLLSKLEFEPVFTAHPTEAKRRGVRRALRRLRRDLFMIDREHLLRGERHRLLRRMRRDMARLWYTDPVSARKPTVIEELERTLFAVHTLWRVGPNVIRRLRDAFEEEPDLAAAICRPLHFGNWIGGDRDGNPFVTCKVTQQTLQKLRSAAIRLHRRECRQAQRRLTLCAEHAALPQNLQQRIDETCERWPQLRDKIDRLHPQEWLARWLVIVDQRLRHSEPLSINGNANGQAVGDSQHGLAYRSGSEFADDVAVVRHALEETDLAELAQGALRRWEDRIAMFGLHMLRLDTRVNSTTLKQALTQLLANAGEGAVDYALLDEAQRQALLTAEPTDEIAHLADSALDESIVDLLDLFALLLRMCEAGGEEALGHIIISMTHQPSDVLAVLWLLRVAAKRAGIEKPVAMSVVPLFETIDDLQRAEAMMREMLGNPAYREHVRRCGDEQTCMIGYSDSAKDGGYLASNWALYRTQRSLADATEAYDVRLTVFHGRGGAIGRGGGPAARAILSLPAESVFGKLRITEQGEVIAERYDDPAIAGRHLEQLFWATLKLSARRRAGRPADADAFAKSLAQRSLEAYRRLTDGPLFEHYLHYCTALPIIENLPIGSRPSRRSGQARVEDLRAIPFTFAWNQVRMPINAFYGLGEAFSTLDTEQRDRARRLYNDWPWMRAVVDNAELALARCDTGIARHYAQLAPNREQAMAFWETLYHEHDLARSAVLQIKQETDMLAHVPWLQRTIRVRTPYVDLINFIQIELIRRLRADPAEQDREAINQALRLTVQGIAAGIRNTG